MAAQLARVFKVRCSAGLHLRHIHSNIKLSFPGTVTLMFS